MNNWKIVNSRNGSFGIVTESYEGIKGHMIVSGLSKSQAEALIEAHNNGDEENKE